MPEDGATSPFLLLPPTSWVASNSLAFAIRDRHPVSPGHTLVITRRPVPTWFDATPDEQLAILRVIDDVRRDLDASHHPFDFSPLKEGGLTWYFVTTASSRKLANTRESLSFPALACSTGAPHGLTATHQDQVNADLLAFLRS